MRDVMAESEIFCSVSVIGPTFNSLRILTGPGIFWAISMVRAHCSSSFMYPIITTCPCFTESSTLENISESCFAKALSMDDFISASEIVPPMPRLFLAAAVVPATVLPTSIVTGSQAESSSKLRIRIFFFIITVLKNIFSNEIVHFF